jgi:glycerol-3-phosphate acyltransferase PlsY
MSHVLHAGFLLFLAYVLGSIPFGLLIARTRGLDIRQHGSRNIGATNVWRVLGWKFGLPTFFCDWGKGFFTVIGAAVMAGRWGEDPTMGGIYAAVGCIFGHNFPIWLGFKGGKGVATSLGVIFGMVPLESACTLALWFLLLKLTRYVSVASVVASLAVPVFVMLHLMFGPSTNPLFGPPSSWAKFYFAVAAALLITVRHLPNIRRLLAGTEPKVGRPKTAAAATEPGEPPASSR